MAGTTDAGPPAGEASLVAPVPESARRDLPHVLAWAVGLCVFTVYVFVLAPAPYLLDSAELAAASFGLGIAHPPGETLALLWGKLFCFLPLGSVAFRVGLGSAVAAAVAAGLVVRLSLPLLGALDVGEKLPPWARATLGATAGIGFGLCPGVLMSANRPEVYALAALLALAALRAAGSADPRGPLLGALAIGLGFANHPLIAAACGLGAAVAALPHLRRVRSAGEGDASGESGASDRGGTDGNGGAGPLRFVGLSLAALVVGLSILVYLPARAFALAAPGAAPLDTLMWGDARSLSGLWWILSGRTFLDKSPLIHSSAAPASAPFVFIEELGLGLCLSALCAGVYGLRVARARRMTAALLVTLTGALGSALFASFVPTNPDIRGYLAPGLGAAAILGAAGLGPLLAALKARWPVFLGVFLISATTVGHLVALPPQVDLRQAWAADRHAARLQSDLPPRAAVFTSHFETGFLLAYGRQVEGRRPDAAWVHLGFVGDPGYRGRAQAAYPELVAALDDHRRGRLSKSAFAPQGRPVLFEAETQLGPAVLGALFPDGHLWRLGAAGLAPPPLAPKVFAEAAADRQVRGFFGWRTYLDARLACARAIRPLARLRLAELDRLLPHDRRTAALATSCKGVLGGDRETAPAPAGAPP